MYELKKDCFRVIMKVDKGNCFVVLDREEYDSKMEFFFVDWSIYEVVIRFLFGWIECDLNVLFLNLKR